MMYTRAADGFEPPRIDGLRWWVKWEFHDPHQFSQRLSPSYNTYFTNFSARLEVLVEVGYYCGGKGLHLLTYQPFKAVPSYLFLIGHETGPKPSHRIFPYTGGFEIFIARILSSEGDHDELPEDDM